jgi:hypothetical protein
LKDTAVLTEVTPFVPQLNPMNRYTLALIYMPGKSVLNGCHLDNQTSRFVIEPILGKSYYTVEFIGLSIPDNTWVDKYQVKMNCNSVDSWMVKDYVDRVLRIIAYKMAVRAPVDIYVGGPDARAALKSVLRSYTQVCKSLPVFTRRSLDGQLITITVAEYHPSYGINSGDPTVQCGIRDQFNLYKAVCAVADLARFHGQPITEDDITEELECEHVRRLEQKTENIRVLAEFMQQDQANIQKVMTRFPSIGYNDVEWLVSTVAYLEEHSMTRVTATQRIMLATS